MTSEKPQRLCSEIQLFDLCDLEFCSKKNGRYCTNPEALERFEAIQEEDERSQYVSEEYDEENDDEEGEDLDLDPRYQNDDYEDDDL